MGNFASLSHYAQKASGYPQPVGEFKIFNAPAAVKSQPGCFSSQKNIRSARGLTYFS